MGHLHWLADPSDAPGEDAMLPDRKGGETQGPCPQYVSVLDLGLLQESATHQAALTMTCFL